MPALLAHCTFGDINSIEITWGPACGNDVLSVTGDVSVPEPHVLSLLAFGLAGLVVRRRSLAAQRKKP